VSHFLRSNGKWTHLSVLSSNSSGSSSGCVVGLGGGGVVQLRLRSILADFTFGIGRHLNRYSSSQKKSANCKK
jgi:hypothetical protein